MLPDNTLSRLPAPGPLITDQGVELTPFLDYKMGGVGIGDTSKKLDYQLWRGRVFNPASEESFIMLDARFSPEYEFRHYPNIVEFNFCFDFNMRPMAVYVAEEKRQVGNDEVTEYNTYLYWFDNTLSEFDTIELGPSIRTPKLVLDDPREEASSFYSNSDVCLFYWRSGNLCVRYLRDRFTIETILKRNVPYIKQVGMNVHYRLQWDLFREADTCGQTKRESICSGEIKRCTAEGG